MADKTFNFKFTGDARDLGRATSQVSGDLDSTSGKISTSAKAIAGAIAAAFAVEKIISFGTELYNIGAQAELWDAKANIVFGDQLGMVQTWADGAAGAMGMTSRELTGLAANMGDLLVPMGATREEAATMSMGVSELSGALSAWSGGTRTAAEVNEILSAALLGERDSLKSLGISINQAEVDQRALTIAQADGRDSITQLDQAMATNQLILEKSTDAQAAWADGTMDSVKKSNELSATIATLKENLGTALLPVIQNVTAWIVDDMIPALTEFKEWLWPKLQAAHDSLTKWWADNGPKIVGFLQGVWEAVQEMGQGFMDAWNSDIKPAVDDLMAAAGQLWAEISKVMGDIGGALDGMGVDWGTVGNVVGKVVGLLVQFMAQWYSSVAQGIAGIRSAIGMGVAAWETIKGAVERFMGGVRSMWSYVSPKVNELGSIFRTAGGAVSLGMAVARGALNLFHGTITRVYNALVSLKNMFNDVKNALSARISIPTPSWPKPPSWMSNVSPFFHAGTHSVPGAPGSDVPAVLQAGERVMSVAQTRQADRGAGGGSIVVNAYGATGREMVAEIERAVRDGVRAQWLSTAGVTG